MFILIWLKLPLAELVALSQFFIKKRQYAFAGLLVLLLSGFSLFPVLAPGIEEPAAVEPYFNGVFPDQSPTGAEDNWEVENAFPKLTFQDPMALLEVPGAQAYYVVGKDGVIYRIPEVSTTTTKEVVLDFSSRVDKDGDSGVMNAILHPEFGQAGSANRGYIYVLYRYHPNIGGSGCGTNGFIRLSRFNRPDGSAKFDPDSEFVLVQTYDQYCWHIGGGMFFDTEGYFYFTIGDAGEVNAEQNSAQQIDERLLSGLFRIDLEMDPSRSHPIRRQQIDPIDVPYTDEISYSQGYYIPNDNPWQDENGGVLEEFYALGFRSPHRASMDEITGDIYVGDVGEGTMEEISVVTKGSNLQWPFGEGSVSGVKPPPASIIGTSTPPIFDYSRATGNAVIGGFVYRGDKFQGLEGRYLFGDHGVRNIWTLNPANGEVQFLLNVPGFGVGSKNGISSFATNTAGDVFILKLYGQDMDGGVIYKLKRSSAVPEPPGLLSQTGVFSDLADLTPAPGLVPYRVNAPLWSDRAKKKRWIALPNDGRHDEAGEQVTFSETGSWQFPSGTVFVKHFELPIDYQDPSITKRIETRFLVITKNGGAYGLTYKWKEDGSDAELLTGRDTRDFNILNGPSGVQTWDFPSRTDCMTCHNANAQFVLGANTWQLNGNLTYASGITDNQLNTWQHLGMFANPIAPEDISGLLQSKAIDDESASPGVRVRSYLDANCAHCHRPGGVEGAFDARFSTSLPNQNLVNIPGISRNTPDDHFIIKPKDTSLSEIWLRDGAVGLNAMPPLAKNLVDEQYMSVLTEWINSLDADNCYPATVSGLEFALPPKNYDGPVEINTSNGGGISGDGKPITIGGQVFAKGLGVHAYSEVTYNLNGEYVAFESYIGVDDETKPYCMPASVQFEVYLDGDLAFKSDVMRNDDPAQFIRLDVVGASEMKLVVSDAGDGPDCDHADWANPTLFPCGDCDPGSTCDDGDPCTTNDQYDTACNCAGTLLDTDGDGICDTEDKCPGYDDKLDADQDGIPDGCDDCSETAGTSCDDGDPCTTNDQYDADCNCVGTLAADTDRDGIADSCDECPGHDDRIDSDEDGIPDGCDACVGMTGLPCDDGNSCTIDDTYDENCNCVGVLTADSDNDGVCDALDQCPGSDDGLDEDQDGVADACDRCPGFDDYLDENEDGVPDDCECPNPPDPHCELNDCSINSVPITSDLFFAPELFSSRGLVKADSSVVFKAGLAVILQPGFQVEAGASFKAEVLPDCDTITSEEATTDRKELSPIRNKEARQNTERLNSVAETRQPLSRSKVLKVKVRPNPFRNEFKLFIEAPLPEMKRAIVRVLDTSGRIFYQKLDAPFNSEFTITAQPGWGSGVYIVQVRASNYFATRTIIKQ